MDDKIAFYQESNKVNLSGFIIAYLAILAVALICGYFYTVLIIFVPLLYFNFFITIGFGLFLGYLVRVLIKLTHNRNKTSHLILAFVAGFLANYFQWIAFIIYAFDGEIPSFRDYLANLSWVIEPQMFFSTIGKINRIGLWSVFGITFSGVILTLVWIFELITIIIIPILMVYKSKTYPYSEDLGKWYKKYTLSDDYKAVAGINSIIENLQKDACETINQLGRGIGWKYSKVHVYFLENEQNQYLDFENIYIGQGGRGKKNTSTPISNFKITNKTAKLILNSFDNKRERFEVF